MRFAASFAVVSAVAFTTESPAQTIHQLPATPSTVAYGRVRCAAQAVISSPGLSI